jgi:hypothetical protein
MLPTIKTSNFFIYEATEGPFFFFLLLDIDECARSTHDCGQGQSCINRVGGYICQCPSGHVVNERKECVDVDECTKFAGQVSEDLALLY